MNCVKRSDYFYMKNCLHCNAEIQDEAVICKFCKKPTASTEKPKKTIKQYILIGLGGLLALSAWYISIPAIGIWYLWKKSNFGMLGKVAGTFMLAVVLFPLLMSAKFSLVDTPKIIIESPTDNAKVGMTATIVGVLKQKDAKLMINGSDVSLQDGKFSYDVTLKFPKSQFLLEASGPNYSEKQTLKLVRDATPEEMAVEEKAKAVAETKAKAELAAWAASRAGKLCKAHPEWDKQLCQKLADGKYWTGMTYDMLVASYGSKPNSANPSNYGGATQWQWCWHDYKPSCFYDNNGDGVVDAYN